MNNNKVDYHLGSAIISLTLYVVEFAVISEHILWYVILQRDVRDEVTVILVRITPLSNLRRPAGLCIYFYTSVR